MATRLSSPTAKLLRNSRIFSLPPPLPRPTHDRVVGAAFFDSDTATLPYPTHAAIETTQSSLSRGDWGLKRPLPLKSTAKSTTPIIRVDAIDSIDHITDFNSAGDHVFTLRKWQELDMPITTGTRRKTATNALIPGASLSVFESEIDNTDMNSSQRWKYRGPYLPGKTEGQFNDYIKKQIKARRPEFQRFLRRWVMKKKIESQRSSAIDKGEDFANISVELSEEEFKNVIVRLRQERSEIWGLVWKFLDLPGEPLLARQNTADTFLTEVHRHSSGSDLDSEVPTTHASAGLSYLRTASHVPNHPVLGPLSMQRPIQGRVIQYPVAKASSRQGKALIGLGGIVGSEPNSLQLNDKRFNSQSRLDPDLVFGEKLWLHPKRATIDSRGRIGLFVEKANENTLAVWETQVDQTVFKEEETIKGRDRRVADFTNDSRRRNPRLFVDTSSSANDAKQNLVNLLKGR